MGFIIKPVVTEKMNAITEKSSVDKTIKVANERSAKKHNATAETRNYIVKNKRHPEGLKKEKTVYTYVKPAQPRYGFIVKPEANKLEIKRKLRVCIMFMFLKLIPFVMQGSVSLVIRRLD